MTIFIFDRDFLDHCNGYPQRLPPIISLACSEDHADKLCAIATLRGIASDPETRIKIVEEGGLEPLALGARVVNVEVHREGNG